MAQQTERGIRKYRGQLKSKVLRSLPEKEIQTWNQEKQN